MRDEMLFALLIPVIAIVGGFVMAGLAFYHQTKRREMAHRERMAMIERGLVPPPEVAPLAFAGGSDPRYGATPARVKARSTTAGITLIGIGFGLMVLISFTANAPQTGVGVGGAIAILGAAFFANNYLAARAALPMAGSEPQRSAPTVEPEKPNAGRAPEAS
jgi:hypothetical protein